MHETFSSLYNSDLFNYLLLPIFIFLSRICDVSIGTIRIVMVSRGEKVIAPILGFFEVLIWLIAITKIMSHLDNWMCYIAYATGFATGNYIGLILEEKLAKGYLKIQVIATQFTEQLIQQLSAEGFGVTFHEATGSNEKVNIVYTIFKRTQLSKVINIIKTINPEAFYSIEDIRYVKNGVFPLFGNRRRMRLGK